MPKGIDRDPRLFNPKDLFDVVLSEARTSTWLWREFCRNLSDASRVKITCGLSSDYVTAYVILMPGRPLLVGLTRTGIGYSNYGFLYYFRSSLWSNCLSVEVPFVSGGTGWMVDINAYLAQTYLVDYIVRYFTPNQASYWGSTFSFGVLIDATASTFSSGTSDVLLYRAFAGMWDEVLRAEEGSPVLELPSYSGEDMEFYSDSMAVGGSSRSTQMWPEKPGLATRYIDNVGVFMRDYHDVDYNLSHTLGPRILAVRMIRWPDSGREAQMWQLQTFRMITEFLTIGSGAQAGASQGGGSAAGGIASAIAGTYQFGMALGERILMQVRAVYPRVRGFGRQVEPIPSYDQFRAILQQKLGQPLQTNGITWYNSFSKIILVPDAEMYYNFVKLVTV